MPRAFPDCYAQTPEGKIMIADGMNPVKIWDGLAAAPVDAGVDPPETACNLAAAGGKGAIFGIYQAYVRFLDADGNVSNLSPISPAVGIQGPGGAVIGATNTQPIEIQTGAAHGLVSGDIVLIQSVQGNTAANGTWEITVTGTDTFQLDGSSGDGAYTSGGTWIPGADEIDYTSVPTTTDPKVARKQILRNTSGQLTTFYVDVDTDLLGTTTFSSSRDDNNLSTQEAVPLLSEDGSVLANAHYKPPDFKTVFCPHSSRMLACVDRVYSEGNVVVTNGSPTVTGIGTAFTASLVDRYLLVDGASTKYVITAVNTTLQTLTLESNYSGSTNQYATYAIRPADGERRLVWYTQAGQVESWSPLYALEIQEDGDELTGLMAKGSFIYILEYRHIYRFTFQSDPAVDGFIYQSCQRGVVNNRCWVQVEDDTYMLDKEGLHAFGGGQESQQVSTPIQRVFQTLEESDHVINWNAQDLFHAALYPQEEVARWFVSMGSSRTTRHAICLHYRTRRWWLEEYPVPVTSSTLGLIGPGRVVFLGTESYTTLVSSVGYLDGIDKNAGTLQGEVDSADLCSLTDGSASFPPTVAGLVVVITHGKGKLQRRRIFEVESGRLKITMPWRIIPDSTSRYQIGGVTYRFRSEQFTWIDGESEVERKFGLHFEPSPGASDAYLRIYNNQDRSPQTWQVTTTGNPEGMVATKGDTDLWIDLTREAGFAQQRIEGRRDDNVMGVRRWNFELAGVGGAYGTTFYRFIIDGVQSGPKPTAQGQQ